MGMDDRSPGDPIGSRGEVQAPKSLARDVFRVWMRDIDGEALSRVGLDAIHESTNAIMQIADMPHGPSAETVFNEMTQLATSLIVQPSPSSRWWRLRKPETKGYVPSHAIAALIERLDRRRDDGARRTITLKSARTRLERGERALEDALLLIDALGKTIEAGARELRAHDPARAAAVDPSAMIPG